LETEATPFFIPSVQICPHLSTIRLLKNITSRELANPTRLMMGILFILSEYVQGHPLPLNLKGVLSVKLGN
jgi:hypothetical protein